jgi:flagellar basal body P-ring formation protein FlgA
MSRGKGVLLFFAAVCFLAVFPCGVIVAGTAEDEIVDFIKRIYTDREVQVAFARLPHSIKDKARVKTLSFSKVPDAAGDGICLVSVEGQKGTDMNVYVPFKVQVKRAFYSVKHNMKKGDTLRTADITAKETFFQGPSPAYPAGIEDIVGRAAKKEMLAGEIITKQMLEEQVAVAKGEIVSMTVENKKLLVQAKGTALEKGKLGDLVRVKSASGREVIGRVTGNSAISIEF